MPKGYEWVQKPLEHDEYRKIQQRVIDIMAHNEEKMTENQNKTKLTKAIIQKLGSLDSKWEGFPACLMKQQYQAFKSVYMIVHKNHTALYGPPPTQQSQEASESGNVAKEKVSPVKPEATTSNM